MSVELSPWELLPKKLIWRQLGSINGKRILDFGSGQGVTADHFAAENEVVAVEPDREQIRNRSAVNRYTQMVGSTEVLRDMESGAFDVILCHNVLEYARDRRDIARELERVLKPGGMFSLVKHNRNGRVMQMVVLLNNFEHANALLDGVDGHSGQFGVINYYNDDDIVDWARSLTIENVYGVRTFWHLQQNQAVHHDIDWQNSMMDIEMRVGTMAAYRDIAFFHHLILRKPHSASCP